MVTAGESPVKRVKKTHRGWRSAARQKKRDQRKEKYYLGAFAFEWLAQNYGTVSASHMCLSFPPHLCHLPSKHEGHFHISCSWSKSPEQTAVASLRKMAAQIPLLQQIITSTEDGGLKSIFDLANVHADIFQEITGGEGIKTLREFVSS